MLSKEPDMRLRVNDIWVLEEMKGEELQLLDEKQRPRLEIQVAQDQVFGKGICNRFSGSIEQLTEKKISFNQGMASTRMMCQNIEIEDTYFKALLATQSYTIGEGTLILHNAEGEEILKFKETD